MAGKAFQELKRIFGDHAVSETDDYYVLQLAHTMPESDSEAQDPPYINAIRKLWRLKDFYNGEVRLSESDAQIKILKVALEKDEILEKFDQFYDREFVKYTVPDQRELDRLLQERALAALDSLDDNVRWFVKNGFASGLVFTTSVPVENAQGVMYHLMGALGVTDYTAPRSGKVPVTFPASFVTEQNIADLEAFNAMKVKKLLAPAVSELAL